jgi:transcriptional regulator GlxA family with amidase domain
VKETDDFYSSDISDEVLIALHSTIHEASLTDGIDENFFRHIKLASEACAREKKRMKLSVFLPNHGMLSAWQLRKAKSIMASHISEKLTTKDVAMALSISLDHFVRSFKNSTGHSPHRWIMRARLERAKHLLLNTSMPLSDIALRCGYTTQCHFTRVFSHEVGMSPGAWRRAFECFFP